MRQYYTVEMLRNKLNDLVEDGMGERAVSFEMVGYDEGYDGDYVLVCEVSTKDDLETTIYLQPTTPEKNNEEWDKIEAEGNRRLDEE